MKITNLKKDNINELHIKLNNLLKEYFNLRIKLANKTLKKTHLLKIIRHNIARIKMILTEKGEK